MPKVLRIINRFNLGGPTFNASYLSRYLPEEYETLLVGGDKEEGEDSSGFIPEQLGLQPMILPELQRELSLSKDRQAYRKIKQIIRDFQPDIVHTHASKAGAVGRLAAYEMKVPVIVHTFHGHVFHSYFGKVKTQFYKEVERFLARRSTAIIAISELQKKDLVEHFRIVKEEKVHVIPLGFDLKRFHTNKEEKRLVFRKEFGLADDCLAVGIIGRIAPIKNHKMFIDAMVKVKQDYSGSVRFFIIGDGELTQELMQYASAKGLSVAYKVGINADLMFTSWRKDTDVVMAGLDMIALTSLNEGTPVTLIEAQAAGKPILSTNVGGVPDVVSNQTAVLVESGQHIAFADACIKLLQEESLRSSMAENGWQLVNERFSYVRLAQDMDRLYKQLLMKASG